MKKLIVEFKDRVDYSYYLIDKERPLKYLTVKWDVKDTVSYLSYIITDTPSERLVKKLYCMLEKYIYPVTLQHFKGTCSEFEKDILEQININNIY